MALCWDQLRAEKREGYLVPKRACCLERELEPELVEEREPGLAEEREAELVEGWEPGLD